MTFKVLLQDIKKLETDALIFGFYEDVRPLKDVAGQLDWLLCGSLSDLLLSGKLRGSSGEVALLTSRGKVPAHKLFLAGLGPRDAISQESLQKSIRSAVTSAIKAGVRRAVIEFFNPPGISSDAAVQALEKGISDAALGGEIDITVLAPDAATFEKIARLAGRQHV